ncbi:hypothetical protein PC129_g22168 [Phytophthora cactorum]|uniref:HTH CENPB-type domain-containing protein n=1 Tax=Phytophthora cactorum TaxID=29920 RepID=A0A8T1H3W5_9STRA|nr:hypothetical protein PC111_g23402 [Phytophthora cactorum]KAG2896066.1 hypothetical protein PC114_g15244 [Phytophthora cactorum]KAG2960595.1 hypothetical protein PC119_g26344 [Phytophthora cactorum]KAG2975403.1 hypothetical protein PC118_g13953 [Phytophthora cactorum]KAG3047942.1 hypothetical protein PC122_g23964 [Phytophthora cactorum]
MDRWMKIQQKRGLIKKASERPDMTQEALAVWAKATYKLKRVPAQTTILDILKNTSKIMSDDYSNGRRRKPLRVTSAALEDQLWAWIQKVEAPSICLSRELIKMKARDIQQELYIVYAQGSSPEKLHLLIPLLLLLADSGLKI